MKFGIDHATSNRVMNPPKTLESWSCPARREEFVFVRLAGVVAPVRAAEPVPEGAACDMAV